MRKKDYWLDKNIIDNYSDKEFLFYTIYFHGAATLAGEKVASLITFCNGKRKMRHIWEQYRLMVKNQLSIECFELKRTEESVVVFFFNRERLQERLYDFNARQFLRRFHYNNFDVDNALNHLSKRFKHLCPHEIGIFLGYPIEDVKSFVNCPDKECVAIGYWKVYNDVDEAMETFRIYDHVRNTIIGILRAGVSPTHMTTHMNPRFYHC